MGLLDKLREFVDERIETYHDESVEDLQEHVYDVLVEENVVVYDPESDEFLTVYERDEEGNGDTE